MDYINTLITDSICKSFGMCLKIQMHYLTIKQRQLRVIVISKYVSALILQLLLATGISFSCVANSKDGLINIATALHPLDQAYKSKLSREYQKLGYKINWVAMPIERSMIEANQGDLDAVLHVPIYVRATHPNLILIRPDLFDLKIAVQCNLKVTCAKEVLFSGTTNIAGPSVAQHLIDRLNLQLKLIQVENVQNIGDMVRLGKYDYGLVLTNKHLEGLRSDATNYFIIQDLPVYHALSPNHKKLAEKLQNLAPSEFKSAM